MSRYVVNEVFGPTLQGEGARAGTVNWWLRFAACNLTCKAEVEGFDCDTDFSNGRALDSAQVLAHLEELRVRSGVRDRPTWVVVSGGEPGLQLDTELVDRLHRLDWLVAVETNGTKELPGGVDWISCSPKTAEHTLRVGQGLRKRSDHVDELRYVRAEGQALPKPRLSADHYCISPAFEPDGTLKKATLDWCVTLCMENPRWRLSVQQHKLLRLR